MNHPFPFKYKPPDGNHLLLIIWEEKWNVVSKQNHKSPGPSWANIAEDDSRHPVTLQSDPKSPNTKNQMKCVENPKELHNITKHRNRWRKLVRKIEDNFITLCSKTRRPKLFQNQEQENTYTARYNHDGNLRWDMKYIFLYIFLLGIHGSFQYFILIAYVAGAFLLITEHYMLFWDSKARLHTKMPGT